MYQTIYIDPTKPQEPQWAKVMRDFGAGPSPGGAAAYLGISRQSVAEAINRGALRACKVYEGTNRFNRKLSGIFVDAASLDAYKELRDLNGGRIPYRAKAI